MLHAASDGWTVVSGTRWRNPFVWRRYEHGGLVVAGGGRHWRLFDAGVAWWSHEPHLFASWAAEG